MIQTLCRCLSPKRILNPYTNKTMVVPCGHCKACALNKSNHYTQLLQMESKASRYTVFVTLTFANNYIPVAEMVDAIDRPFGLDLIDCRSGELLANIDHCYMKREEYALKFNLNGKVPYLDKTYLQKFLKRLRYYVSKTTKAPLRYFACGEYGPVHFRPHFHLLLFFDSEEILQVLEQSIYQSWPFGRIDIQLSKGKTSGYVAGYLNSIVGLPAIFKSRTVQPFCVHSSKLGLRNLQGQIKEVYKTPVEQVIRRSVVLDSEYREVSMPVSFTAYFFPKCKGFCDKNTRELFESYTLYDRARAEFPDCQTVFSLAQTVAEMTLLFASSGRVGIDDSLLSLLRYFDEPSLSYINLFSDVFDKFIHRVYIELLVSKHFLYDICDWPNGRLTKSEIQSKIAKVVEFYKKVDYLHLKEFFDNQSLYFETDLIGESSLMTYKDVPFYPYFYDNVDFEMDAYNAEPAMLLYSSEVFKQCEQRVKHKYLNDKNKIFCED